MLFVVVLVTFRSKASAPAIGAVEIFMSGDVGLLMYCTSVVPTSLVVPFVATGVVEDDPL